MRNRRFAAAFLDRDGTLVDDVPYNGNPAQVRPVPGAREALARLRAAGLTVGVVSNQSGIGRGLLVPEQVERVNARVEELLGPFDVWRYCPHVDADRCGCRKPRAGMVLDAARASGVRPGDCVLIGDIGADVDAALSLAAAAGFPLPEWDDGRPRVRPDLPAVDLPDGPYLVVHPGASVPARAVPPARMRAIVVALAAAGHRVVVTGGPDEVALTACVAGDVADDRGGRTDLAQLAALLRHADALVAANTGPAHLAAAVGTPVVSLFAPTVPWARWRPYGVPVARLGDPAAPCRDTRATTCPVAGHPCLSTVDPLEVVAAVDSLRSPDRAGGRGRVRILLWHVHAAWATAFVHGGHTYLVPATPDRGRYGLGRPRTYAWPDGAIEVTPEDLAGEHVDVAVLQRPADWELAREWLGGRRPGRDVPVVYVEHNTPKGEVPNTRHPMADRDDLTLVHVTHFNDAFWDNGATATRVIEHGIPDPGVRWTGDLPRIGVAINEPVRRWRVTGTDLLPRFAAAAPLDVYGMRVAELPARLGLPAERLAAHEDPPQWTLHAGLARHRLYLHPHRWTSLGLSLLEAMTCGVPVVALATTEAVAAVPPAAGALSTNVSELVDAARWLLHDDAAARRCGEAAREAAVARYGLPRFLSDWDALLKEVTS